MNNRAICDRAKVRYCASDVRTRKCGKKKNCHTPAPATATAEMGVPISHFFFSLHTLSYLLSSILSYTCTKVGV